MAKYKVVESSRFKKGLKKSLKQGKDKNKLEAIIDLLEADALPMKEYRDHELNGWKDHRRELHIESDWLLVYRYDDDGTIRLLEIGDHANLRSLASAEMLFM